MSPRSCIRRASPRLLHMFTGMWIVELINMTPSEPDVALRRSRLMGTGAAMELSNPFVESS